MRYGIAVALLVLALIVAAVFAVPSLLPRLDSWGKPLIHEVLTDDGWKTRWSVHTGKLELRKGRLLTSGSKEARFILRQPLSGTVAVEFTAELLPGARACDLCVNWIEDVEFADDGTVAKISSQYELQLGAFDNAFSCIKDPHNRTIAYSNFVLTPGKSYRVRAEFSDADLRMFADGKEILHARLNYPISTGHVALRFFYPGKAISDITLWQQPVHDDSAAMSLAASLTDKKRYAEAAVAYQKAAAQASPAVRGRLLYGAVHSLELAKDPAVESAWASLKGTDHEALAVLHDLDLAFAAGDHAKVTANFPAAYAACPERLRHEYALSWTSWINNLYTQWLPLAVYQSYLDTYLASLTTNTLADEAASRLFLGLHRHNDVVARFPHQVLTCTRALIDMGKAEEALKRFGHISLVNFSILSDLGRYNDALLASPPWAVSMVMREMGKNEEVLQQFSEQPIVVALALQGLGRYQEIFDRFPDLTALKADCLAGLGRFDEALALLPKDEGVHMGILLRMGKGEEALPFCVRDFYNQQTARDIIGLQACIDGKLAEAKQLFTPNTPYFYGWKNFGFRYYIIEAALFGMVGDTTGRNQRLREAAGISQWRGTIPTYVALLTGETPIEEAKATMTGSGLVALGIAYEQAKTTDEALATYKTYLAQNKLGDQVVQQFVMWRIRMLSAKSASAIPDAALPQTLAPELVTPATTVP